jgi:hypothetical protein
LRPWRGLPPACFPIAGRRRARVDSLTMARAPQPLTRILASDATLAAWDARRRRETAIAGQLRQLLPRALADRIRVADAGGGDLELAADAGAIAAMLRQRAPDLLVKLQREGWQFTAIRVRVQVRTTPAPAEKELHNQLDRNSLRPLAVLAKELPEGPLKTALARFVRRAG